MKTIKEMYELRLNTKSDINEHLPIIKKYADECDTIVEFGVRWVTSTYALLQSSAKSITSYDIQYNEHIKECEDICNNENRNWTFNKQSSLECTIDECDLLFIDSLHTYDQLKAELKLHPNKVNKYIMFHDTIAFPELMNAINEFLSNDDSWEIKEHYTNNNGLLILEKTNETSSI